jgi:uncharacterized protein YggT (Ycf19 family)
MARTYHVRPTYMAGDEYAGHRLSIIAVRIVNLVGGVVISLLTLRFVLSMVGANPTNAVADFIYSTTQPLVSPFFGLFSYTPNLGVVRFEFETLIAIIFYSILTIFVASLLSINRRLDDY